MRRARRVDAVLTEFVKAYRELGCSVWICNSDVDAAIGYGGLTELIEVRSPAKIRHNRADKMTPAQVAFRRTWTGGVRLVQSLADVHEHVNNIRWRHAIICQQALRVPTQNIGVPEYL